MMNTKMKGEKVFLGFSPSCLGRAMVVVVSLVPRPHLYWSGYEANFYSLESAARPTSGAAAEIEV